MTLKIILKKIRNFTKEHLVLMIIFLISTIFFLIQHYFYLGWDFSAYSLNARYLFYGGNYYEVYRAPLISILLGIFMIFGYKTAEYLYIIFVCILFFFSAKKLMNVLQEKYFKNKINKKTIEILFYLFLLNPFLLKFGLLEGTELLALSFFQLFLSYFLEGKISGYFLALAVLSRYNFFIFFIFFFFTKDYKKIIKDISLFFLVLSPWLLFNFFKWGHPLTSIIDSYYLNIFSRQDLKERFLLRNLLYPINYLLPFFICGIFLFFYKKDWKKKVPLVFMIAFFLFLIDVYKTPFKIIRYMFNLSLPIAFFSLLGAEKTIKKFPKTKNFIFFIFFLLFLSSILSLTRNFYLEKNSIYAEAGEKIKNLGLENCTILSNIWVPVSYYSENVVFLKDGINKSLEENKIVLILKGYTTIDDMFKMEEIKDYQSIYENEKFVLLGKQKLSKENCFKKQRHDIPLLLNPCSIIEKIKIGSLSKKICEIIRKN